MIVNLEGLGRIKEEEVAKKIVLATGTFDLFHYEHLKYLEGAKKQGDILVVAIKDDKSASLKDKNRPIINENQRLSIIDSIRYVDYSLIAGYDENFEDEIPYDNKKQQEWLNIFGKVFKILKPNILYYENNPVLQTARERIFLEYNINGVIKERGTITSTSEIIKKIINNVTEA